MTTASLEELAAELRDGGLADPASTFRNFEEFLRVRRALDRQRERGLKAFIVRAEPGRPLEEVRPLWTKLGLNEQHDLMLLYNGTRWEAKGWGLSAAQISGVLELAEPALRQDQVAGFEAALNALAALVPEPSFPWVPVGAAGLVGLVGLGWVIARRRKLRGERKKRIAAALSSAEAAQAEVMLAAEELPKDAAAELQLRAATLADVMRRAAEGENEAVAIGRIEQLESELNALHSDVLARTRRGQP